MEKKLNELVQQRTQALGMHFNASKELDRAEKVLTTLNAQISVLAALQQEEDARNDTE